MSLRHDNPVEFIQNLSFLYAKKLKDRIHLIVKRDEKGGTRPVLIIQCFSGNNKTYESDITGFLPLNFKQYKIKDSVGMETPAKNWDEAVGHFVRQIEAYVKSCNRISSVEHDIAVSIVPINMEDLVDSINEDKNLLEETYKELGKEIPEDFQAENIEQEINETQVIVKRTRK